jgi:hypothetical protein
MLNCELDAVAVRRKTYSLKNLSTQLKKCARFPNKSGLWRVFPNRRDFPRPQNAFVEYVDPHINFLCSTHH